MSVSVCVPCLYEKNGTWFCPLAGNKICEFLHLYMDLTDMQKVVATPAYNFSIMLKINQYFLN
jgi:hypothetical protein